MYPFYNVSANTSDMHAFAAQNGCVVASKDEREAASKKWAASSSNEMSRPPGADIDTPMTPLDPVEMTHTGLAGHSYNVRALHLPTFEQHYCSDVQTDFVHGFEKKVHNTTPQMSLNEFGHSLAFRMFFDIDLALFGPPEAIDQSIIALICTLLQASMRAFWPHLTDEEWLTVGEMYVTQSLARVKDPLTFLRKCKEDAGRTSNHRTRKGSINSSSPNDLMLDESANDGFVDPFASSTPPSLSSSVDAASFFSSSLGFNPMASSSTSGSNATISCASTPPSLHRSTQIFRTGLSASSAMPRGAFYDHALSMPAFNAQAPTSAAANKEAENEAFFTAAMIDMMQRIPEAIVEYKIGLHVHFPNTVLRCDQARRIRMYIIKVVVSQIALNPALVNLTRICMFTNKPFERDALIPSKTTALAAETFWNGVIEDVYDGPLPHCKKVFSHKMNKSGCVTCALAQFESQPPPAKRARGKQQATPSAGNFQAKSRDNCPTCNGNKKMAIGPAAVSDLIYALDGSGKSLPMYASLAFDPSALVKQATRNNYVDVGLARVASASGLSLHKSLLEPQPRFSKVSHDRLLRLLADNPVFVEHFNVDAENPRYLPIRELPLPLRRFSAFLHQGEQLAYITEVVGKTSIRLHKDGGGMSEAAWEQFQHPTGFTFPKSSIRIGNNQALDHMYGLNKPLTGKSRQKFIPSLKLTVKTDLVNHLKSLDAEWRNVSFQSPYFLAESPALRIPAAGRNLLNDHRASVLYTGNAWIFEAVGLNANYCTIIGKCHTNNTFYLKITPMHIIQLCHSKSMRHRVPCTSTFGKIWRLPERFRDALFVNPKGEAAKLIADVLAIWNSPAINFTSGQSLMVSLGAVVPAHVAAANAASSSSNAQATLETEERTLRNAGYILPGSNNLNRSTAAVSQQPSLVFSLTSMQASSSAAPILPSNNNLFM